VLSRKQTSSASSRDRQLRAHVGHQRGSIDIAIADTSARTYLAVLGVLSIDVLGFPARAAVQRQLRGQLDPLHRDVGLDALDGLDPPQVLDLDLLVPSQP
jgi:hypothetical protein